MGRPSIYSSVLLFYPIPSMYKLMSKDKVNILFLFLQYIIL